MAKFGVRGDSLKTIKDWAPRLRGLTFEENMQTTVNVDNLQNRDVLYYNDGIWEADLPWEDHRPDVTPGAGMTLTAATTRWSRYKHIGRSLTWNFNISLRFGGVGATTFDLSLPDGIRTASNDTPQFILRNLCLNGFSASPGLLLGIVEVLNDDNKITISRLDGAPYTTGLTRSVEGSIEIEVQ